MPTIPSYSILLVTRLSSSYLGKCRVLRIKKMCSSSGDLPELVYFLARAATRPGYTSELLHTPSAWCSLLRDNRGSLACLFPLGSSAGPPTEWCLSWCLLGSETAQGTKHIQTGTQSSPCMKEWNIFIWEEALLNLYCENKMWIPFPPAAPCDTFAQTSSGLPSWPSPPAQSPCQISLPCLQAASHFFSSTPMFPNQKGTPKS